VLIFATRKTSFHDKYALLPEVRMLRKMCRIAVLALALSVAGDAKALLYENSFKESFDPAWSSEHSNFFIHSIPKCGTHYIQRIIHLMFPEDIAPGQLSPANIQEAAAKGRIVRAHCPFSKEVQEITNRLNYKCVSMVRDPRDALISLLVYMDSLQEQGPQRDFFHVGQSYDDLSLDDKITRLIKGGNGTQSYIDYYMERIQWSFAPNSLMVRYEDLIGDDDIAECNKMNTILQIAEFTGLDISTDHLCYVLENMYVKRKDVEKEGKVYERASSGNWKEFLNEKHKRLLKKKIGHILIQLGYEEDDNW
jgi:hypothetical protein